MTLQVAVSWGMFLSSSAKSVEQAQAFAPLIVIVFLLFGGFYANPDNIPTAIRWLSEVSFFKWGFKAMAINEYETLVFVNAQGVACTERTLLPNISAANASQARPATSPRPCTHRVMVSWRRAASRFAPLPQVASALTPDVADEVTYRSYRYLPLPTVACRCMPQVASALTPNVADSLSNGCAFVNGQQVLQLLTFDTGSVAQCLLYLLITCASVHTAAYYCLVANTQVSSKITVGWAVTPRSGPMQ